MRPVQINFYTRQGCHLCDEAWQVLEELSQEIALELRAIDIDSDPELVQRYGNHIPVATMGSRELFRYRADRKQLRNLLQES